MREYILILFIFCLLIVACSDGTIPTAVEPLIELQATYITGRPVIDGVVDEVQWEEALPYLVHIGERDLKTGQIIGGYNVEMKALWWQEWGFNQKWGEQYYVAISLTWPDDAKNMDKRVWTYNPADLSWMRSQSGSDWFIIRWLTFGGSMTDLWYWDAAITNPMGYMEDQFIESFEINDSTEVSQFNIDGLRFLNDIETQNNCWDENYNDNLTPRDSTDDFPMKFWRNNPQETPPTLPRIYTSEDERTRVLLQQDAEFMVNAFTAPFTVLEQEVTVPGYVLEDPLNSSADIVAAGKYHDGNWTVELVRPCKTADEEDVIFNPNERYTSYYFTLLIGDNSNAPFSRTLTPDAQRKIMQTQNSVRLTFEFIGTYEGD